MHTSPVLWFFLRWSRGSFTLFRFFLSHDRPQVTFCYFCFLFDDRNQRFLFYSEKKKICSILKKKPNKKKTPKNKTQLLRTDPRTLSLFFHPKRGGNAVFRGKMVFSKGKMVFSIGKCSFPGRDADFQEEMLFSKGEMLFPKGKCCFSGGNEKQTFQAGERENQQSINSSLSPPPGSRGAVAEVGRRKEF